MDRLHGGDSERGSMLVSPQSGIKRYYAYELENKIISESIQLVFEGIVAPERPLSLLSWWNSALRGCGDDFRRVTGE